jgi:3-oxoacyl-[acyl-carrier protein] reductase
LGRAAALELAEQGARVVLFGPHTETLAPVCQRIEQRAPRRPPAAADPPVSLRAQSTQPRCLAVQGDVAVQADVQRLAANVSAVYGKLDILINNAAVIGPPLFSSKRAESTLDEEPDPWWRTIEVNFKGVYLCCRFLLPLMREQRYGRIVNVTSGLAAMSFPRFSAYSVSKAAVDGLTRALSAELAVDHIYVKGFDPGVMDTAMQERIRAMDPEKLGAEIRRNFVQYKERGHLKDPAEAAKMIVYLAGDAVTDTQGRVYTMADLPTGYFGAQ